MRAKVNESPGIKSEMDDVAEAVAAVKRDLISELPKMLVGNGRAGLSSRGSRSRACRRRPRVVSEFRNFLRSRFGDAVVRVLDHRLEDQGDTKELVGTPGLETAYKVKQAVSQLKDAIRMFAGNDP